MNSLNVAMYLAIILPILGIVASVLIWRRWKAPVVAKVLVVLAVLGLAVPVTCGGIVTLGEATGVLKPARF